MPDFFFSPRDIFAILFLFVPFLASLYAFHMEENKITYISGKRFAYSRGLQHMRVFLDRGDVLGRKDSRRQQTWALYRSVDCWHGYMDSRCVALGRREMTRPGRRQRSKALVSKGGEGGGIVRFFDTAKKRKKVSGSWGDLIGMEYDGSR